MPAPLLLVESTDPDNSDRPLLTLDASRVVEGFWTSALPDGYGNAVQILGSGATPGVLQPGETMRVPVYYAGLQQPWDMSDTGIELRIRAIAADDATVIDWDALKPTLKPADMSADAWNRVFSNVVAQTGPTWGDYVKMLDDNASYLGRLGKSVVDIANLWQFEVRQANDFSPIGRLASSLDAGLVTPGASLSMGRSFASTISGRYVMGPFGFGWSAPWQASLSFDSDGSITLTTATGYRRRFST